MKRFPAGIMCTCVVPWDERGEFIESLFVDQVRRMLKLTPYQGATDEGFRQFAEAVRTQTPRWMPEPP